MNMTPNAREIRRGAAEKYRPTKVRLLLVAEAPPSSEDRYFYFEDLREQDSLFRYVCKGLFGVVPARSSKAQWLERLKTEGVFLVDLMEDPIGPRKHSDFVANLIQRCRALQPDKIVLIKASIFDASFLPLRSAGLNVSDVRVPFPGSGQQKKFEAAFASAIGSPSGGPPNLPSPESSENRQEGIDRINRFLQEKLSQSATGELAAVEAARMLDQAGLLKDSKDRPGKPLRDLLRRGRRIEGSHQQPNSRWFIRRVSKAR